jgi:uncharacterized protein (DUF1800 family)
MLILDPFAGNLGEKNAAHLLRRATFGPTIEDIKQFSGKTVSQAMDILFTLPAVPAPPVDPRTGNTWLNPKAVNGSNSENGLLIEYFIAWHLDQMRTSGTNIRERIVYFLHSHLPTRRTIVDSSEAMYYQNCLFRYYSFGSFKDLFKKICIDNAMLVYIDGRLNINQWPNENFAREMLELYSIGKGLQIGDGNYTNYTEQDIKEAARVLSGYKNDITFTNLDTDTSIPIGKLEVSGVRATLHDAGTKTFSTAFQNTVIAPSATDGGYATATAAAGELSAMIDMIFNQDETARFLCRKLYRFFVYYKITPEVETQIIVPLAQTFKTSGYNLKTVVSALLSSQHFYDSDNAITSDNNIAALIKSPVDLVLGGLRFFNVTFPVTSSQSFYDDGYRNGVSKLILDQGLEFYEPYDVAGYDAYFQIPDYNRNWITPINLANRYLFSQMLIENINRGETGVSIKVDLIAFVNSSQHVSDPSNASLVVKAFTDYLFAVEINSDRFNYFLNTIFLESLGAYNWTNEWNAYKAGGSNATVKLRLETLVTRLIQTPEFQLF